MASNGKLVCYLEFPSAAKAKALRSRETNMGNPVADLVLADLKIHGASSHALGLRSRPHLKRARPPERRQPGAIESIDAGKRRWNTARALE